MHGDEPLPNFEGIFSVSVFRLVPNHVEVSIANDRQDVIERGFDSGTSAKGARERFGGALGISLDRQTHFRECRLKFSLPQQEIPVSPRNLGGKRISSWRADRRHAPQLSCRPI